jgi:dihydrodipicolinate synthase/N-acetylneuraminate lyase
MFLEPNPQPAKAACALRGWMRATARPPMVEASDATKERLTQVLWEYQSR